MTHYVDSFPGREICINGESHLYFGGTSYLGLQTDSAFQDILISNIKKYGTNYGASRKSNIQYSIYNEVETYLSGLVGSEDAITLSSGYLAGQLVTQYYNNSNYTLFYTPNTHSALAVNNAPNYASYKALKQGISAYLATNPNKAPVIFLDSIDFSGKNYPHFTFLKELPLQECILVVDDSHGIGILGKNGGGVFNLIKALKPKEVVSCCSLSKGFGIQAGVIFGKLTTINSIKNTSFFGGASPASPACIATLKDAEDMYRKKREQLNSNLLYFTSKTEKLSCFSFMKGHPSFTFENKNLSKNLEKNKIVVTNFNYPNKNSPLMSRIVLSASHTKADLDYLIKSLHILLD
ncbi:pyridoxal phosphate-dependent aminotransferase family protein [uncultured Maribacter sp.]|uniref:pyridoxal phosphate-dependent aminotransferase family protein n=1 Tax=uncultured Maribacter sp. TaxID=431308 RepID=UPI00261D6D37|nr:pyridoxal phosphate-dependent aminotransferase family protein [uncultured Maribacter sp.]